MSKNNEYQHFSQSSAEPASARNLRKVLEDIENSLPSPWKVLTKLTLIHLVASTISLILCPQFGVHFFAGAHSHSLMDIFMLAGHHGCYLLCGVFYLSCTFILAKFALDTDHWIVLRRHRFLTVIGLSLISMGALSHFGQKLQLELAVIWFFGAYLGGSLLTREWWKLKLQQN
ncbi:MAG: hypothetical protein ACLGGX_05805 [Bdellovibrionia bacterium]